MVFFTIIQVLEGIKADQDHVQDLMIGEEGTEVQAKVAKETEVAIKRKNRKKIDLETKMKRKRRSIKKEPLLLIRDV